MITYLSGAIKLIISVTVLYRVIAYFWLLFQQDDESIMTSYCFKIIWLSKMDTKYESRKRTGNVQRNKERF